MHACPKSVSQPGELGWHHHSSMRFRVRWRKNSGCRCLISGLIRGKCTHLFSQRDHSHAIGIRMAVAGLVRIPQQYLSQQPRRDFKRLEQRRRRGMELFAQGVTQAEVARRCQVTETTSFRWKQAWIRSGSTAWRRRPLGRPPTKALAQSASRRNNTSHQRNTAPVLMDRTSSQTIPFPRQDASCNDMRQEG